MSCRPSPLLVVTTAQPRSVVYACRLPSIQEPHLSQDKQSLQLSSAIKGTGDWQIKRRQMTRFLMSLRDVCSLKVTFAKVCLFVCTWVKIFIFYLRICAPGCRKTPLLTVWTSPIHQYCSTSATWYLRSKWKQVRGDTGGAQTSLLKGSWDLKD